MDRSRKYYLAASGLFFFLLFCLSLKYYRERVAFADTAFQSVYLMIEQRPCINWLRPGAIIPQILPLMAVWMHSGIKVVMQLHSVSFYILYAFIFLRSFLCWRQGLVFMVMPFSLIILSGDVFFWPQSELQQGIAWLCLYAVSFF